MSESGIQLMRSPHLWRLLPKCTNLRPPQGLSSWAFQNAVFPTLVPPKSKLEFKTDEWTNKWLNEIDGQVGGRMG